MSPALKAQILNNLGLVETELGRPEEAKIYLLEAIENWKDSGVSEQKNLAISLTNAGMVHLIRGDYRSAQSSFRDAVALFVLIGAQDTIEYSACLNDFAQLRIALGDWEGALELYIEAQDLVRKLVGDEHPYYAASLHNLGVLAERIGDYELAEGLLQAAGPILRSRVAPSHPEMIRNLNALGTAKVKLGKVREAEDLVAEALRLRVMLFGEQCLDTLVSMNNLAIIKSILGRPDEADRLQRRTEALGREILGEGHPNYAEILCNLATICAASSRLGEAEELFQKEFFLNDEHLATVSSITSEAQRAAYLRMFRYRYYLYLAFLFRFRRDDPEGTRRGLDVVLRRKAIGAEALLTQWTALLGGRHPELKERLDQLLDVRQAIARTLLDTPDSGGRSKHLERITALKEKRERIESELASMLPEMNLRVSLRRPSRAGIAQALPVESVLIELVHAPSCDFGLVHADWGEGRYFAFILHAGEPDAVHWVDLGPAQEIDVGIQEVRRWVARPSGRDIGGDPLSLTMENDPGDRLRKLIFDPLVLALKGRRRLIIAPDGPLSLLPFEVLPTSDGKRLIDDYVISYVSVGRDVLRFAVPQQRRSIRSLVVADPDFDLAAKSGPGEEMDFADQSLRELARTTRFNRLTETRVEGERIARLLNQDLLLEGQALEGRLKKWMAENGSPRVLHLATHGFFLDKTAPPAAAGSLLRMADFESGPLPDNPLLRSGLALAGANTRLAGGVLPAEAEDGLLLAEDIAGLDFLDTEMVVLSACNTGMGEVQIGEGVLGLRRAFASAGARTLVMSLWTVPDLGTRELMEDFYRRLLNGQPRVEALRDAQLSLKLLHPHPSYWGAFICQGDPGPLELGEVK